MDKTFEEIIYGVRHAEYGVEVREDIAQGMEYVERFADTATAKAEEAEASAQKAEKFKEASASSATSSTEQAAAAKKNAEAAADSQSAAKSSADASQKSAENSKASENQSADYLQATKEYFEQVRTVTLGAQGWYATPDDLKSAVPTGENGWWAVVGTTDTIWTWDSDTGTWKDSSQSVDVSDFLTQEQIKTLLSGYMPLRAATADVLGGVKLSEDFTADEDGTLHLAGGTATDPYPVGIVISMVGDTSPAALFGGTWEEIAQDRALMGASSAHAAGTTVEAGLPNITGSVGRFASAYSPSYGVDRKRGALSYSGEGNMRYYSSSGSGGYGYYIDFNASSSNAIYGRSSTVQPAAYYVHIWHRVA